MIAGIRDALGTSGSVIGNRSAVGFQRLVCELRRAKYAEMTDIIQFSWGPEDYGFR